MPARKKDFKLLAIRPRKGCHTDYCKNLGDELLYQFYGFYEFETIGRQPYKITPTGTDHGLFNKYVDDKTNLNINVSAIVGKNGSGKSSLTELLFLSCYLVAIKNGILKIDQSAANLREQRQYTDILTGIKAEIYYAINDKYYCIVLDNDFQAPKHAETNIDFIELSKAETFPMASFFYTIAINYSIYGLNESTTGRWVGRLFHKNDGYQTPVVINPFRNRGTININGEIHFAQSRLLANLMVDRKDEVEVIPGKKVTELSFIIDRTKLSKVEEHGILVIKEEIENATGKTSAALFEQVYKTLIGQDLKVDSLKDQKWRELTVDYVIGKLVRIAMNYEEYNIYYKTYTGDEIPGLIDIDEFLDELKKDHTHITLKLRQALNFYRYDPLRDDKTRKIQGDKITISIAAFSARIRKAIDENTDSDPMAFIPIAPFTPRLMLDDQIQFHKLSSGEQQYINSVQSIIYHVLNLNSVFNNQNEVSKVTYDCINIVLDEIELYFHPEFQRTFVRDLLKTVSHLKIPQIKSINVLFLTHSPFILSDIPASNVLRIKPYQIEQERVPTFAGNIHQMLATSFFMDSTSGEFARDRYREIIDYYEIVKNLNDKEIKNRTDEYREKRKMFGFIISQIGEVVIKGVLENHIKYIDERLLSKRTRRQDIRAQIESLNQELDELNDQD